MKTKLTAFLTLLLVVGSMIQTNAQNYGSTSYGIFVHYGFGGTASDQYGCSITQYADGSIPGSVDEVADNFDVQGFVDDIAEMSPEYLIFTAWHCWQYPLYPSAKIEEWLDEEHYAQRDVIQELLDACEAKGIDVYLYIQPSEAHNFSPAQQAKVGYINRSTYTEVYNDFLNEMLAEVTNRYKTQIKGFWFDKGLYYGCTDTERIGQTVRAIMPDAEIIANTYAGVSADFGAVEIMSVTSNFEGEGYPNADPNDVDTWPAFERSISFVSDRAWFSQPGSIRYTSEEMYKYTVLEAGVNEEGGGVAWAIGPYPTTPVSWNQGILSGMTGLGAMIDEVGESIKNTVPSDSWPTAEGARIQELDWGIATRSADGDFEYLHVLNAPSGNTLNIDAPDDGREYISAVNLRTGNACSFSQTSGQVSITLHASDSWHSVDAVIKLTASGGTSGGANIALNGTASQSSTAYSGAATRAIDGNTDGEWAGGSVTHTGFEDNAWWEVDLGDESEIDEIVIFNRTDAAYMDRLSDFTVTVLDDNGISTFSQTYNSTPNPSITVSAGCVSGSVVRVQLNTTNTPLSLAEVEVYTCNPEVAVTGVSVSPSSASLTVGGTRQLNTNVIPADASNQEVTWNTSDASVVTVDSNGLVTAQSFGSAIITATTADGGFTDDCTVTVVFSGGNLALIGTASQSSTAYTGDASRANDDNTDGAWSGGSVTHTAAEDNPWWEIDLGDEYSIAEINIFGRTDACCAARLSDYTVSVINGNDIPFSADLTDFPEGSVSAGGVYGRIIRVQLNATNTALSLAEVQVYEGDGPVNPTENTFTIQENESGFCSVDGNVNNNNLGYTGDGFANTANALGNGVNWEINGSAGSYTFTWRYASSNSRPGNLLVDGVTAASNVLSNPSGSWSVWTTESTTVTLGAGVKTIRLEATTASGLGNIDYLEVTGPDAAASGCQSSARVGANVPNEANASMFSIYPNPVEGRLNIELAKGEHAQYHVLNTSGQIMLSGHIQDGAATIDLSDFNKGIYLIKVAGESTSQIRKVIKN